MQSSGASLACGHAFSQIIHQKSRPRPAQSGIVATINLGVSRFFCIEVPDLLQHDGVVAVVKAWPIEAGAWSTSAATASLDDVCARRHGAMAGRDEETVPRSNKETDEAWKTQRRLTRRREPPMVICGSPTAYRARPPC